MPSYMTLTVLALAASTVSPALSAPVRVTREQALNNHELVNGKRGAAPELAAEVAAKASKSWGQRLKGWALNLLVGGVAASAGTAIYGKVNPNSSALGGGESKSTSNAPTTAGSPTASPGPATGSGTATGPGPATGSGYTTGPGYVTGSGYTTGPGYATGSGYTATGYPPAVSPSTSGTTTATRAIAERAREGRALDRKFSADISTRSNSNLNSRTPLHENLLSRADLEKAIGLFSRMLDELD